MALRYGYFDSDIIGIDEEGMPIFDRAETSDLFALLLSSLVSDGVLALPSTCFKVRAAGNGMNIEVQPGFGMVKGHFAYDDEVFPLVIDPAPQTYSRIDRVIMRCNYLERMVEIVVKKGEEAAKPVAPELIRPAAGDYFELCLANITLSANQTVITDSSIGDTRADSAVCGYITQLIDHLDTAVFFEQLNAFYQEFVDKSNADYEQFKQMITDAYINLMSQMTEFITNLQDNANSMHEAYLAGLRELYQDLSEKSQKEYDSFHTELTEYIKDLKDRGNTNLAAITQQLLDFRNTNEADFLNWWETLKGLAGDGQLLIKIEELESQIENMMEMLLTGNVYTNLITDEGDYITDDLGYAILVGRPICQCNIN